jgi:hypothetical protein
MEEATEREPVTHDAISTKLGCTTENTSPIVKINTSKEIYN